MVSLCLTNPRLNGIAQSNSMSEDGKSKGATVKRQEGSTIKRIDRDLKNIQPQLKKGAATETSGHQGARAQVSESLAHSTHKHEIEKRRENMLRTIQAMGDLPRSNGRSCAFASSQYNDHVADARTVPYRVHKWRLKSGRSEVPIQTDGDRQRRESEVLLSKQGKYRHTHVKDVLPPINLFKSGERVRMQYKERHMTTVQDDKESRFRLRPGADKKDDNMIIKLRNSMQQIAPVAKMRKYGEADEKFDVSEFSSPEIKFGEGHGEFMKREIRIAKWKRESSKQKTIHLPPISRRLLGKRVLIPDKTAAHGLTTKKQASESRVHKSAGNDVAARLATMANHQTSHESQTRKTSADTDVFDIVMVESQGLSTVAEIPSFPSPTLKKTSSSMTLHSGAAIRSVSKDGDTPESDGSSVKPRRFRKMKTSRTLITKSEGRGSPKIFRHMKPSTVDTLMWKWYVAAKLSIWVGRLCRAHRMFVDDQYNIKNGSGVGTEVSVDAAKREVLFDVTDYKMKNQLRLSDTTRRILTLPSDKRTDKEINLVQAALRNIKAVSDHSTAVQRQIGRHGYFVGFDGKRIVVREGRHPLNYYILLAGSAVVIKEDESGNTNPVQFLKRGDVFGDNEILDDVKWRWSIATSGYSEFLLLDRETYQNIFITGGGGGLLTDPDRGEFLRSVALLNQWPTELLNENPNRCLFRYFKRGALLVRETAPTEWIYVIKSGSCSVMKMLQVEELSKQHLLQRARDEQRFKPDSKLSPRLVEKANAVSEEDHLQALEAKEEQEKIKANEATVFQQLEMSTVMKELNADVMGLSSSPQANLDEFDHQTEFPLSSSRTEIRPPYHNLIPELQENKYVHKNGADDFRMSRNSDRHPPRTPSPMKAAYLRTGVTPTVSLMTAPKTEDSVQPEANKDDTSSPEPTAKRNETDRPNRAVSAAGNDLILKHLDLNKYFGSAVSSAVTTKVQSSQLLPTHINVRKLTKGDVFGVGSTLYNDQPSLSLVSNGAECLMLNKRFYLDNATEDCIRGLRDTEYPYPNDEELLEQHQRLMTWRTFQSQTIDEVLERQNKMREHMKSNSFI